jgi:photosystem I P700 chlorophyll a apoprotein A2
MMASFVHGAWFLIQDYAVSRYVDSAQTQPLLEDPFARLLASKPSILSHLSWVSLLVGAHTTGLFIHNDTVVGFGEPEKQLAIEPLLCAILQESSDLILSVGPGDWYSHHSIALGLHVSVLILMKGSLDGRGSSLMPDKMSFGYGFSCDGPTRGGTCDISSWDSFYLAAFWVLNVDAWLMFYFHWRQISIWQGVPFQYSESATYLCGWFRDYLWFNSAQLINGYSPSGSNDQAAFSWAFLGAHLCWATGFMFLISWRG